MKKILTIITTAYNEEKNIERYVETLLNQKNKNFKVIFVNDGSTDNTLNKINEYSVKLREKGIDILILDIENQGLSKARNIAIDEVIKLKDSEYISFVDCDDTLKEEYTSKIENAVQNDTENEKVDILKWNLEIQDENQQTKEINKSIKNLENISGIELFEKLAFNDSLFVMPSLYAIRLEYMEKNNFKFMIGKYHEDYELIPKIIINASKAKSIDIPLYNYILTEGSITRTTDTNKTIKKAEDTLEIYIKSKEYGMNKIKNKKDRDIFIQFYTVGLLEKGKEIYKKANDLNDDKLKEYSKEYLKKLNSEKLYKNIKYPYFNIKRLIKKFIIKYRIEKYLSR